MKSVSSGPVTNHFSPLRTYVAGRAVADRAWPRAVRASEPAPSSVMA